MQDSERGRAAQNRPAGENVRRQSAGTRGAAEPRPASIRYGHAEVCPAGDSPSCGRDASARGGRRYRARWAVPCISLTFMRPMVSVIDHSCVLGLTKRSVPFMVDLPKGLSLVTVMCQVPVFSS